ncbi:sterol desaturase family protein [Thermoproteota archaeon]
MQSQFIVTTLLVVIFFILEGVFPFFKERRARFRHAFPNLVLGFVSSSVVGVFFRLFCDFIFPVFRSNFGMLHRIFMPAWLNIIIVFLILDGWIYIWHRLNHVNQFLWRFHKVHHADPSMDSTTAVLFHPIEMLISLIPRILIITFIGIPFKFLMIYELVFVYAVVFHHSNINIPSSIDRFLRIFVVTPYMHKLHHSIDYKEGNSNFSTIFSFWDRIARTFVMKRDIESLQLGIKGVEENMQLSIKRMLMFPFKK